MKILCIARNYADHAKELNNPVPDTPVVFLKPATALLRGKDFILPDFSSNMQYECELVFRISKQGKHIGEAFAGRYVDAVTVGIDFTARDVQTAQKEKGLPWEIAKAFDQSAVIGTWKELDTDSPVNTLTFSLEKNGSIVQQGNAADMLFPLEKQISYLSSFFTLQTGDLLFTGTPTGVGKVDQGDVLSGYLGKEKVFEVNIK